MPGINSFLDRHKDVTKWNSEEVVIPYRSPLDNKIHRYFTDFFVEKIGDVDVL
jgi:hypothetical protein